MSDQRWVFSRRTVNNWVKELHVTFRNPNKDDDEDTIVVTPDTAVVLSNWLRTKCQEAKHKLNDEEATDIINDLFWLTKED